MRTIALLTFICLAQVVFSQNVVFNDSTNRMQAVSPNGSISDSTYTEVSTWNEGFCYVNKGDLYGFIDTNFNEISPFIYDDVFPYHHGFAGVGRDSLYTFINRAGLEISKPAYTQIRQFEHGIAPVRSDDGWGLIDTLGKLVFPCEMDYPADVIHEDFIRICQRGKWGVLHSDLEFRYPARYDYVDSEGRAFVEDQMILLSR